MNIFICGFSGAGKSTFLHRMKGQDSNWGQFLDLDDLIAKSECCADESLGDWIRQNSFELFRKKETECLGQVLSGKFGKQSIISLGGGALSEKNYKMIRQSKDSFLVFIKTPFETCYQRITGDNNRPLSAKSKPELQALYQERLPLYLQADLILDPETAKEIEGPTDLVHNLLRVSRKENGP